MPELPLHSLLVCDHKTQELSMNNPKIIGPGIAPANETMAIFLVNDFVRNDITEMIYLIAAI